MADCLTDSFAMTVNATMKDYSITLGQSSVSRMSICCFDRQRQPCMVHAEALQSSHGRHPSSLIDTCVR